MENTQTMLTIDWETRTVAGRVERPGAVVEILALRQ
jgi:hypothetical protein